MILWNGHVFRHNSIFKELLQGTVGGKRKRGRRRKMWLDHNIISKIGHGCLLMTSLIHPRTGPNDEGWWLKHSFAHPDSLGQWIDDNDKIIIIHNI